MQDLTLPSLRDHSRPNGIPQNLFLSRDYTATQPVCQGSRQDLGKAGPVPPQSLSTGEPFPQPPVQRGLAACWQMVLLSSIIITIITSLTPERMPRRGSQARRTLSWVLQALSQAALVALSTLCQPAVNQPAPGRPAPGFQLPRALQHLRCPAGPVPAAGRRGGQRSPRAPRGGDRPPAGLPDRPEARGRAATGQGGVTMRGGGCCDRAVTARLTAARGAAGGLALPTVAAGGGSRGGAAVTCARLRHRLRRRRSGWARAGEAAPHRPRPAPDGRGLQPQPRWLGAAVSGPGTARSRVAIKPGPP